MTTERVFDAAGREWTVEQRVRAVTTRRAAHRARHALPAAHPAPGATTGRAQPPPDAAEDPGRQAAAVAVPFVAYDLLLVVLGVVTVVVLLPLVVIEAAAQVVASTVLAALRTTGLVRRRVEVTASTAHYPRSKTVPLVCGRVRELMATWRPSGGTRSHRSIWQSSDEWR